jgi:UDP-N-acetylglucosamine--N-acetylmuramyl-(pentapeptide) pyrophosphoryl-undecaprenol N-acetylglucosamine transferase
MTFVIAAAGTGGHVYPGLAVGEALVAGGVEREAILFVGGDRIESIVYPGAGFPFLELELRGLGRSLSMSNLQLPGMVWRARDRLISEMAQRKAMVVLGMGGYVTIPAALAARKSGLTLMVAEQNAGVGLANRVAGRWAKRQFVSFPDTDGMESGEWSGNPIRIDLAEFHRSALKPIAMNRYQLDADAPVLGVFGGSLGAGSINDAVTAMLSGWSGPDIQVVHLTGREWSSDATGSPAVRRWARIPFEDRMADFYAVSDLVVARAGGGVAELTATGTPSILVPGDFGSSGHQAANADFLRSSGAAVVLAQDRLQELPRLVRSTLFDPAVLSEMSRAAATIAKPHAAVTIAKAMIDEAG